MIAHLSGTLLSKHATSVIVDVGGVGYEVTIPLSTFYDLEDMGSTVQLRIYTHVREDTLQLYGFKTARERELFLQLDKQMREQREGTQSIGGVDNKPADKQPPLR